ncbi:cation:proton antiporter [Amycolatopsis minnesotensis]|uniref:Cation:proton antiporter n=1 Tax=Amycolatopsis minnesotensis TaxID=337894 RepID=A0ABP5CCX5_9PSEU
MSTGVSGTVLAAGQVLLALAAALGLGCLGRVLARLLRQPPVIGEIVFGLFAGPAVVLVAHRRTGTAPVLPGAVTEALTVVGHAGLALFLVGVAHELRPRTGRLSRRAVVWVTAGTLVPPVASGLLFAWWVRSSGDPGLRTVAAWPAQLLMICVALTVTAVPVLARILVDRGLTATPAGRLAMTAAIVADAAAWILLAITLGFATGSAGGVVTAVWVVAAGLAVSVLARPVLRLDRVARAAARHPWPAAVVIGTVALGMAAGTEHAGLTGVLGAVLAGLAIPGGSRAGGWAVAVGKVVAAGRLLVPVYFVTAGLRVFAGPLPALSWWAVVLATALAITGKVGGGYLGARLGGLPRREGVRIGVLVNTRGLTEIVLLQTGFTAGLLSPALFVALVVMALVTTVLTGPLLSFAGGSAGEGSSRSRLAGEPARPKP